MKWLKLAVGLIIVLLVVAVFLPGTLDSGRASKWRRACGEMDNIVKAETGFSKNHDGRFATPEQLVAGGLVRSEVWNGQEYGYKFSLTVTDGGYELHAVPVDYKKSSLMSGTGAYSFYADQRGLIYGADKSGERATSTDAEMICSEGRFTDRVSPK